jgi:hypothetical protein
MSSFLRRRAGCIAVARLPIGFLWRRADCIAVARLPIGLPAAAADGTAHVVGDAVQHDGGDGEDVAAREPMGRGRAERCGSTMRRGRTALCGKAATSQGLSGSIVCARGLRAVLAVLGFMRSAGFSSGLQVLLQI